MARVKTTAAPDPNTKSPKFKPPPLACDAHCHVFGPAAKFPYAPDAPYWPPDAPFEALQALHAKLGIERAVIVHASCHGADMRVTLDAIARSGGKYRGTAIIDENYGDQEFKRMHDGGIRGVRFNFVKHLGGRPDIQFFDRTVARLKDMGWHLILHLDSNDLAEFRKKFEAIAVPMVIDHMGRVKAADGLEQEPFRVLLNFLRNENFWVKVCGAGACIFERPALHRCGAVRPRADRGGARAHSLGHRLAASERRQAHAQRRRPGGPFSIDGSGCRGAEENTGGQPGAALWLLT